MPDLDDIAIKETLLGNAVFASYDGYQLCLRSSRERDHFITLDPKMFREFVKFAQHHGVAQILGVQTTNNEAA